MPSSPDPHRASAPEGSRAAILREALGVWAAAFVGLVAGKVLGLAVPFVAKNIAAVAAFLFLFLPRLVIRKRGEDLEDYALPPWPWTSRAAAAQFRRDLLWGFGTCAILVPLVIAGFFGFLELIAHLPPGVREVMTPYREAGSQPALRFRPDFALQIPFQLLVVALPEEFFYRGYLQTRLTHAWGPGRRRFLGVPIGKAFLATQLLFALGHLAQLHVWRLGTFFPALLFGWLKERTGSIIPGVIVHAVSNLLLMTLEASAFG